MLQADREVFIAKEITKKFESHFKGSATAWVDWLRADSNHMKGEFVLVIAGCGASALIEKRNSAGMKILDKYLLIFLLLEFLYQYFLIHNML